MEALPTYGDRYIKNKVNTNFDKVYNIFHGLNEPEGGVKCEFFTIVSIDFLLAYENKYYLKVYIMQLCLQNYKQVNYTLD